VARSGWTLELLRARARESIQRSSGAIDEAAFAQLAERLRFVGGD
jgi:glucose-6-phosphate 1-dehydrogenase